MAALTYFVALAFNRNEEGYLGAGQAQECLTAEAAIQRAQSMAKESAGSIAFSRSGDPSTGEFEAAEVLQKFGEVPPDDLLRGYEHLGVPLAMAVSTTLWDSAEFLDSEEAISAYLQAAVADGDPSLIAVALNDIARALGINEIAARTGLQRAGVYAVLTHGNSSGQASITERMLRVFSAVSPTGTQAADESPRHDSDHVIVLSEKDTEAFFEALDNPRAPSPSLTDIFERHERLVKSSPEDSDGN